MVEHNLAKVGVAGSTPVSRSILSVVFYLFPKNFSKTFSIPLSHSIFLFKFRLFSLLLLFFSSVFITHLHAETIFLKTYYTIESDCITPKTFGVQNSEKCLKKLPENRFRWQIPAFEIEAILENEGYEVRPPKSGIVTFERTGIRQDPEIARRIVQAYKKRYRTIDIRSVTVKPTGSKRERFTFTPQCSLKLSKSGLRRKSGTFVVKCGRKRHFFQYTLDATIGVYKANHQIKKDKIIGLNALEYDVIPFVKLHDIPLSDPIGGRYMARQNIAPGKIVTRKMVRPIPAVTKNERVLCVYEDGPVHIEFEATAMQNGYIGDNITVKKTDGRAIRGVVTGRKRVEIR